MDQQGSAPTRRASFRVLAAVLLLSAAGLVFELTLTRVFSATIWYHYTFVAISVAMFGWGLGGFGVYLLRRSRADADVQSVLVILSLVFAIVLPLFPYAILQFPFTPERLPFYFVMGLLPFLAGGATLSLAFEAYAEDANRLYFADLIGAALGTLMVPVVISGLGAETAILATAILPAASALLLSFGLSAGGTRRLAAASGVLVACAAGLAAWNARTQTLTIRDAPSKGLYKLLRAVPEAAIDSDRWNAYSRITSVRDPDKDHVARLYIDSDAWTNVLRWDGTAAGLADGPEWFRAFPFRFADKPRVLAIVSGSPSVTAVEMNPLIVDCVRRWGDKSGNLYDHPNVQLVIDEGRNFIERAEAQYDLIVLGFVDSWASVASGGLSLTENYLYTRDAMAAYYDHLTERGALVVIRWPTDIPRLVANSVDLLSERGLSREEIAKHILAVSSRKPSGSEPVETVFMLSRSPMTAEAVDGLLAGHDESHVIAAATRDSEPVYADLFSGRMTFGEYTQAFDTLATPVDDDRPFYFATDKPHGIPRFVARLLGIPVGAVLLFAILLLVGTRKARFRAPGARTIAYFASLGVGFIICEVALMQRMILLLGHPIYSLVVILFTLLLAGGLGSLFARRYSPDAIRPALGWMIPVVIALVVLAALLLPPLVRAALFLSLPMRILTAGLLVFPLGFFMGMPFPLGLRKSAHEPAGAPASVLWGINGVASVVGSIGGVALAVVGGFTSVFLAGAACYGIAWATRPK